MVIPTLKTCFFEASEDIMTKFKSQALRIIRIKYWNAGGSGNPPSLIPALWNIDILLIKRQPGPNNMTASVGQGSKRRSYLQNKISIKQLFFWSDFHWLLYGLCLNMTLKSHFECQILSESFQIFFCIEYYQFRRTFFAIDIFW